MAVEQTTNGHVKDSGSVEEDPVSLHRREVKDRVESFLSRYGIRAVVGICGGADEGNIERSFAVITDFLYELRSNNIALLSGGTEGGVPELATKIARDLALPTIGVFPKDGKKYALLDKLDLAIESLPPSYGKAGFTTETSTLVELAQALMVMGGEFGTLVEVGTVLKINKDRLKKNREVVYLCPIKGTGGVAEIVKSLPAIEKVRVCLPEEDIYTGAAAARFVKGRLFGVEMMTHGIN